MITLAKTQVIRLMPVGSKWNLTEAFEGDSGAEGFPVEITRHLSGGVELKKAIGGERGFFGFEDGKTWFLVDPAIEVMWNGGLSRLVPLGSEPRRPVYAPIQKGSRWWYDLEGQTGYGAFTATDILGRAAAFESDDHKIALVETEDHWLKLLREGKIRNGGLRTTFTSEEWSAGEEAPEGLIAYLTKEIEADPQKKAQPEAAGGITSFVDGFLSDFVWATYTYTKSDCAKDIPMPKGFEDLMNERRHDEPHEYVGLTLEQQAEEWLSEQDWIEEGAELR